MLYQLSYTRESLYAFRLPTAEVRTRDPADMVGEGFEPS